MSMSLQWLWKPFAIIRQAKAMFSMFVGITLIFGQLGILISLMLCLSRKGQDFKSLLVTNLDAGNFYTFSIALIASCVAPFMQEYLDDKPIKFRNYKLTSSVFGFLLVIGMTVIYTLSVGESRIASVSTRTVDVLQLALYALSMVLSLYLTAISLMHRDYLTYADLDNEGVVTLKQHANTTTQDSLGNKI